MDHVHLIGIGGTGLSAIALFLLENGVKVTGSDRVLSPLAEEVQAAGAVVYVGHKAENVGSADVVVRSSAIPDNNVEVQAALANGISVVKRVDFLSRLTADKRVIAVAGTHGKTTTTAMIAWILDQLGCQPSYLIGGVSKDLGSNAHAGSGEYFVIEADEYDGMFLGLQPEVAVITNVEHDHPDCYPTLDDFFQAFRGFVEQVQPGGMLLFCEDDRGAWALRTHVDHEKYRVRTYGLENADYAYYATNLVTNDRGGASFDAVISPGESMVVINLTFPGEHMVLDSLAALAVVHSLGLSIEPAAKALSEFQGTGRRFEIFDQVDEIVLIDDYAHHPTEISATVSAARDRYPDREIWVVWQPHTYSRTRTLFTDYTRAFKDADHVIVTDIYAAREDEPKNGFSSLQVVEAMKHSQAELAVGLKDVEDVLVNRLAPGDVVLVLSAGDADQINPQVSKRLRSQSRRTKQS